MRWHSSTMMARTPPLSGRCQAPAVTARMASMPVLVAPSISSSVDGLQPSAAAAMRAKVVLPTPLGPDSRKAWEAFVSIRLRSVLTWASWPITASQVVGR